MLWGVCRERDIVKTFKYRNSAIDLPIELSKDDFKNMQKFWTAHLRNLGSIATELNIPKYLEDLVFEINSWLNENII